MKMQKENINITPYLRCTRHGRVSLGAAKLFAAFFISGAAFVLCAVTHILVEDSLFGWECTRTFHVI